MAIPKVRSKTKAITESLPKKKKISIDRLIAEDIDTCNRKHLRLKKHLKKNHPEDVIDFDLQTDIEKAIKSVAKKYNKALDELLENYQLKLDDKKQNSVPEEAEVEVPDLMDFETAKRGTRSLYGSYINLKLNSNQCPAASPGNIAQANRIVDAVHHKTMIGNIACEPVVLSNGLNDLHGDWSNYTNSRLITGFIEEALTQDQQADIFEPEPA